jgi:NAD(P)-dependent dehydrogenase (short-subunit alcohol dehydrogenase family)
MSPVALVTGSGRGIGAATALLAAKRGYAVCVNYLSREERARAVVDEIRADGGKAMLFRADTADEEAVVAMFEAIDRELGPVTALVNNAGITGKAGRLDSYDAAAIRRVLDINVTGLMLCTREAVRRMSTKSGGRGGAIVNLSSVAAVLGGANQWTAYAAAKGAVNALTVGLAREWAADGIRVNAIAPGGVETPIWNGVPFFDHLVKQTGSEAAAFKAVGSAASPLGRFATADEIAAQVAFLLSDEAGFTTGACVVADGGYSL